MTFGALLALVLLAACDSETPETPISAENPSASISTPEKIANTAIRRPATATETYRLPFKIESDDPRLRRLGIPSLSQAHQYRSMSKAELTSRSSAGDLLAKSILVEKLGLEASGLQQRRTAGQLPAQEEGNLVSSISQMHEHMSALTREGSNAMAGYAYGQMISASTSGAPLEPIAAGIRLAGLRGDPRAPEFERLFMAQNPGLDTDQIEMYYEYGRQRFNPDPPKQ